MAANDAYVDLDVLVAAYAADPVFLKRPQHLGLRRQRHVADLVHEQRAAVGLFELAPSLLDGRGEGAAFVAEEFASISSEGIAAQLTSTNGAAARLLLACSSVRPALCRCRFRP